MVKKLIIEVRVNERATRDTNPNVPWTPDEIATDAAACRKAGAASMHFHARNADGTPNLSFEGYKAVFEAVRRDSDILLHPSLGSIDQDSTPLARIRNIIQLAESGLRPDFAPLDMGSTNADVLQDGLLSFRTEDQVYLNSTGTLRYLASELQHLSVKPYLHVWNIPQIRIAAVFHRLGLIRGPIFMGLAHSGEGIPIHHPATLAGLHAYLGVLPKTLPVEWMATAYGANLLTLAPEVIKAGGHLSIGLGDYAYPELGTPTNAELVRHIVTLATELKRDIATPAEMREMLGAAAPA